MTARDDAFSGYKLAATEQAQWGMIDPDKPDSGATVLYEFTDEISPEVGYQEFVAKHFSQALGTRVALCKEVSAGRSGSIDFIGIDAEGRVFFIEVKRLRDARSPYHVIFQSLRYQLDLCSVHDDLFEQTKMKTKWLKELAGQLQIDDGEANTIAERARKNILERLVNPIIVIDQAPPQLIASAYSMVLRSINSEIRVVELTVLECREKRYLWYRKFFSNDNWVGNTCTDNRLPTEYVTLESKLEDISDVGLKAVIGRIAERLSVPDPAKSVQGFTLVRKRVYLTWGTDGIFAVGMYKKLSTRPAGSAWIVLACPDKGVPNSVQARAKDLGFSLEKSADGTQTHLCLQLSGNMTDGDVSAVVSLLEATE